MRRVVLALIRFYQAAVSPLTPSACRYVPTCSEYAATAVRRFGVLRGGWMAVKRVLRCHPLGGRGPDPVPPAPRPDEGGDRAGRPGGDGDRAGTGGEEGGRPDGAEPAREDPGGGRRDR